MVPKAIMPLGYQKREIVTRTVNKKEEKNIP